MADINDNLVATIAREMAMALRPALDILGDNGLTQEQFETEIQPLAFYKQSYEAFVLEWNSIGNTNRRIAMKAGNALEIVLPLLAIRMAQRTELLPDVTKTAELFGKLAGTTEENSKKDSTDKIKIIINLGADTHVFDKEKPHTSKIIEGTAELLEKPNEKPI